MRLNRNRKTRTATRWRETCVDGVLHVAFAAAVAAETAAERCTRRLSRSRTTVRAHARRR